MIQNLLHNESFAFDDFGFKEIVDEILFIQPVRCKFLASSIYFSNNKKFQLCYFEDVEGRSRFNQMKIMIPIDMIRFCSFEFTYNVEKYAERSGYVYSIRNEVKFRTDAYMCTDYSWCEAPAKLKFLENL